MNHGGESDAPAGSETVRAFIAVPVREELIAALMQIQKTLQAKLHNAAVRWTGIDQFHLTLRFLGNVSREQLPRIVEALQRACRHTKALLLSLTGVGCFPDARAPRVIWVGIQGEVERLQQLQQAIEQGTARFGDHTEERAFHPHLTIGRVRIQGQQARLVGRLTSQIGSPALGNWPVRGVELIQSVLMPAGARYSRLAVVPLEP